MKKDKKETKKFKVRFNPFRRKFGKNRAILNEDEPGNKKYKPNSIDVVQK